MSFEPDLIDAIQQIENCFEADELAYLALTQKVEHAIRDRLAFKLHKRFEERSPGLLVCREWKRADLAFIETEAPSLILEAKAGYTFDIMMRNKGFDFAKLCAADLEKAGKLASSFTGSSPEIYALVIATHPHTAPEPAYRTAVKYFPNVKKYATDQNNHSAVKNVMNEIMTGFEQVHHVAVAAGTAFGTAVSIFVWLYRAKQVEAQVAAESATA